MFCGDLNSMPGSDVLALCEGGVAVRHTFTPMREGDDEESGACEPEAAPPAVETFKPPLRLHSAYEPPPAYTTLTDTFRGRLGRTEPRSEPPRDLAVGVGCLDHILLTRHWRCLATLDMIDEAPAPPTAPLARLPPLVQATRVSRKSQRQLRAGSFPRAGCHPRREVAAVVALPFGPHARPRRPLTRRSGCR